MPIYVGNTLLPEVAGNVQVGTQDVSAVYVGTTEVWSSAATGNGTADWGAYADTGTQFGGVVSYSQGTFSDWAPETLPSQFATINQTRRATTFQNTSAIEIATRRRCNETTAPDPGGSAGTCSSPFGVIGAFDSGPNRVITPMTSISVTPTVANGGIEERVVDNPAYIPPVPFSFEEAIVGANVRIDSDSGFVLFNASYETLYTDAEGNPLTFTVELASGQPTSYTPLSPGADSVMQDIMLVVSGETPDGFPNAGANFMLSGTEEVTQESPEVVPQAMNASFGESSYIVFRNTTDDIPVTTDGQWQVVAVGNTTGAIVTGVGTDSNSGDVRVNATGTFGLGSFTIEIYPANSTSGTALATATVEIEAI